MRLISKTRELSKEILIGMWEKLAEVVIDRRKQKIDHQLG